MDREKQENLYEASSLSRKSTPFPEPALELRVARYSMQALVQQQENEIKLKMHRLTLCQKLIQSLLSPFPTCKGKKETNGSAFALHVSWHLEDWLAPLGRRLEQAVNLKGS